MNSQKPIISRIGAQEYSSVAQGLVVSGLGRHLDAGPRVVGETFVLRRSVGAELRSGALAGVPDVQLTGDLVAGDRDAGDLLVLHVLEEVRERHRGLSALEVRRELPDQDPHHDEDHPEQQALEGRVQPTPPKCLTFKSITPCDGSVTRKSSATDWPTTQTIRSLAVDHERDRIPVFPRHLPIHEEILQLTATRGSERPEPVARPTAADCQRQRQRIGRYADLGAPSGPLPLTPVSSRPPQEPFCPDRLRTKPNLTGIDNENAKEFPPSSASAAYTATA